MLKIDTKGDRSVLLLGPRGTGKTQWIKAHFTPAVYLDLLDTSVYNELSADPHKLETHIPDDYQGWVIIDEVQKIPALLNEVHRLIEGKHYRFVLTGSSARSLRRKGVNLLAGRAFTYNMHPLTAIELGKDYSLQKSLQHGQLPLAYTSKDATHYLSSYVHTYLQEEVKQEGLVRNLASFTRFLQTASFSQGSMLNMAAVARETGINQRVVQDYFDILDDLLIAYRLPVFTRRAKRRLVAHPKFYFFDAGVYRSIRPCGPMDSAAELDGAGLETLLLQELRAINDYLQLDYSLYYWRTQHGVEVDFVLYGQHGFCAFEIKRSTNISSKEIKHLLAFAEDYPEAKLYLLYGGERRLYINNVEIIPFQEALMTLPAILQSN